MANAAGNPTPSSPPITGWKYSDDVWKDDEQLTVRQAVGKTQHKPIKSVLTLESPGSVSTVSPHI